MFSNLKPLKLARKTRADMQTKTKKLIVLLELENGDVHQAVLTKEQESAIKAVLQSLATVQLLSTPLDLKIERIGDNAKD